MLADMLPAEWVAFIDNTAGEAALKKTTVRTALSTFWATAARRGWRPICVRVESKANVADEVSRADLSRAVKVGSASTSTPSRSNS